MIPEGYRLYPLDVPVATIQADAGCGPVLADGRVYPDIDAAVAAIEADADGRPIAKVSYLDESAIEPNGVMASLLDRIERTQAKLVKFRDEHSIHTLSAKLITCTRCDSRIAKDYVDGEDCPVCGNDLRSPYIGEQIAKYEALIDSLGHDYEEKRDRHVKKLLAEGAIQKRVMYLAPVADRE